MSVILLALLLIFAVLMLYLTRRLQTESGPTLRSLPAFEQLRQTMARAIETGRTFHLSVGTGGIANASSADTLAALQILEHLTQQGAQAETPPLVTMSDPATMLLAQNIYRQAYGDNRQGLVEATSKVHWISPEPAAYAAGVMGLMNRENIEGQALVGHFNEEYLLIGETAYQQRRSQPPIAGASNPNVLPLVYATSPHGLWGEEMFAAGAYLSRKPSHIASLLTQDTFRWVIGLIILGGVLLSSLGLWG